MSYGDDCPRSRDIDDLETKTRDLDFDIGRTRDDLQAQIYQLEREITNLLERIRDLEQIHPRP